MLIVKKKEYVGINPQAMFQEAFAGLQEVLKK